MTDTIEQIKEALKNAEIGPWAKITNTATGKMEIWQSIDNGSIAEIHGTDEVAAANAYLIVNTPTWMAFLLGKLETANKIIDAKFVFFNDGQNERRWYEQERIIELEKEHTAMKRALEWINDYREMLPANVETYQLAEAFLSVEDKAVYVLSTLSNKEDASGNGQPS
ncbi:hypothetical protein [Paenibacillus gorillae]|uniref:hypothetical protein n=1 Tax=Paenibacillus gorillae TaxID=1243662 RepID=UPI0004B0F6F0|nr:hypothetical protein [Paenibacillus gorillae]